MIMHTVIPSRKSQVAVPRNSFTSSLRRARDYSIEDVRRCLYALPGEVTDKECKIVFKHARLRGLAKNPLRTLRGYKDEMKVCLKYGNREAHYVEGIKQFFAIHDRPKGLRHLKFSAAKHYKRGNYLYAILMMLAGEHVEGMNLLDRLKWRNNTSRVDKLWMQVKRSLREVPIINRRSYGTNMILIMPPRSCELNALDKRCTKCFYYKEMEKFLQLVYRY